jgi:hypothetical protein
MTARGFVEGRRPTTPDAKITDGQIHDEDTRLQTRAARACRAHLADLMRMATATRPQGGADMGEAKRRRDNPEQHRGGRAKRWRGLIESINSAAC